MQRIFTAPLLGGLRLGPAEVGDAVERPAEFGLVLRTVGVVLRGRHLRGTSNNTDVAFRKGRRQRNTAPTRHTWARRAASSASNAFMPSDAATSAGVSPLTFYKSKNPTTRNREMGEEIRVKMRIVYDASLP